MSLPGTNGSAPMFSDRQLPPCTLLETRRVGFTRRARAVPPSPLSERVILPTGERMEERLRTPAIVPASLRACANLRSVSAPETRHLATPDKVKLHASSLTIRRNACAPLHSGTAVTRRRCRASDACASSTQPVGAHL